MTRVVIVAALLAACSGSDVSRDVGARCTLDHECNERCLSTGAWPGGFCTLSCDTDNDCPHGTACIAEQGGVCVFTCASDPDCAFLQDSYTCKNVDDQAGGKVMVGRGG